MLILKFLVVEKEIPELAGLKDPMSAQDAATKAYVVEKEIPELAGLKV